MDFKNQQYISQNQNTQSQANLPKSQSGQRKKTAKSKEPASDSAGRNIVTRINSVIPEASEREELTVCNETGSVSAAQKFDLPINIEAAKQNKQICDNFLTTFEQTEIDEYEQLFYLCTNDEKIKPTKLERLVNNGFDDEEGYYRIQKGDHIAYRY